jgi:hypothetical protein
MRASASTSGSLGVDAASTGIASAHTKQRDLDNVLPALRDACFQPNPAMSSVDGSTDCAAEPAA